MKTPALWIIGLVCVCATVLCALGQLPSEAATAILGGAIVQVVQLVRPVAKAEPAKRLPSDPPPPASRSVTSTIPPLGPLVGMLGGGLFGSLSSTGLW